MSMNTGNLFLGSTYLNIFLTMYEYEYKVKSTLRAEYYIIMYMYITAHVHVHEIAITILINARQIWLVTGNLNENKIYYKCNTRTFM